MSNIFVSFADFTLRKTTQRIAIQAAGMDIFDKILTLDENGLDPAFRNTFSKYLNTRTRGFGFWSWKPQIILQTLESAPDGSLISYVDSGCHLNVQGRWRLLEYIEMARAAPAGILAFSAKLPEFPFEYDGRPLPDLTERKWVKGDLLDYFQVRNATNILNSPTIGAGILFLRKCPAAIQVVRRWIEVFTSDFRLIDDSKSVSPNPDGFVEHRHDQAIFSILAKLNNIPTLSAFEYWYPRLNGNGADWEALARYPIHARRDIKMSLSRAAARYLTKTKNLLKTRYVGR